MAEQSALDTIPNSFAGLQSAFLPERAVGVDKTLQFDFTGKEAGTWSLIVHDGTMRYHEGPAEQPAATVTVDSEDWLQVLRGELNPVSAFMSGKVKIQGDMSVLMQFQNWFARPA